MSHEPALKRALHELAKAPGPADLSDVALTGARRRRRTQWAFSGLAAIAAAGMVAAPFMLKPAAQPAQDQVGAPNVAASANGSDECVGAPSVSATEKRVLEENWPDFVAIAVANLPSRTDYEMQSGYAPCRADQSSPLKNAYAVINLGPLREHGHLTITLEQVTAPPANCAAVQAQVDAPNPHNPEMPKPELLFCDEATGTTPLVYGTRSYATAYVAAAYSDRVVRMESHPISDEQPYEIGPEALRAVVIDPALAALLN